MTAQKKNDSDALREIGKRIAAARAVRGYTQRTLADRVGMDPQNISRVERGTQSTSAHILVAICTTLRVSADWLLLGRGSPPTPGKDRSPHGAWSSLAEFAAQHRLSDEETDHLHQAAELYSSDPGEGVWLQHLSIIRTIARPRQ